MRETKWYLGNVGVAVVDVLHLSWLWKSERVSKNCVLPYEQKREQICITQTRIIASHNV